ncbi:MAG: DMT family transporter [Pirellulales bacterium]
MPYAFFALICLLFGSNFILMHRATQAFGPLSIAAWRMIGAAAVTFLYWYFTKPRLGVPRRQWGNVLFVGILANGYPYLMQPLLIGNGMAHSYFAMTVAFTPFLTIVASVPILGHWPTRRELFGVFGGLVFLGLIMLDGSYRGFDTWMLVVAVTVPFSYAVANTYLRRTLRDVPSVPLAGMMAAAPALVMFPFAMAETQLAPLGLGAPAQPHDWTLAVVSLAILSILGTGLTMCLFVNLVQTQGPLFAGMVTYVVPLVALMWGWLDSEPITTRQLIAIAGVIIMVALVQYGSVGRIQRRAEEMKTLKVEMSKSANVEEAPALRA